MSSVAYIRSAILVLLCIVQTSFAGEPSQYQIKKFRFNRHNELNFERLVLEFANKGRASAPGIRLVPSSSGKETVINIDGAVLVGAIPEATINDSYQTRSNYFGPISINTDTTPNGFAIRTFVKTQAALVDAFWLENPARLIVDVYPKTSPRASGPNVLVDTAPRRSVASTRHGKKSYSAVPKNQDIVYCFLNASQVLATLDFEQRQSMRTVTAMTVDDSRANYNNGDRSVVCYPKKALMQAKISFNPKNQIPNAQMEVEPAHAPPPLAPQEPVSLNVEQFNKEADMALGTPPPIDLEGRGLASPSFFSGQDDFNKNNPPATLGKPLLPSVNNDKIAPVLANPAPVNLLPPMK